MELKIEIVNIAMSLLRLLEVCDDTDFVDTIVDAIYQNDIAPLWFLEEQMEEN